MAEPRLILRSDFAFGDRVKIDGDVNGAITGITARPGASGEMMADSYLQYEVSWWSNGVHYSAWFDGFRLEPRP